MTEFELPSRKPDGEFELMCLIRIVEPSHAKPEKLEGTQPEPQAPDAGESTASGEAQYAQFAHTLRSVLGSVGESVVVVGGDQPDGGALWNLHVHTDTPEKALEELSRQCSAYGRQHGVTAGLSNIVVRNLSVQLATNARDPHTDSEKSVSLVVCCSSPRLALDISRAGAVVCIDGDTPVSVSGVERALTEVHAAAGAGHGRPIELASSLERTKPQEQVKSHPQSEPQALVISHSAALTQELHVSGLAPYVVQAFDDAQVVAATSAVVELWESGTNRSVTQLLQAAQECLDRLHTQRIEPATRETVAPIVNLIRNNPESIPIVTVLVDTQCSVPLVTDLCDGIERAQSDAEIIVLESGRTGNGLTISVEWVQY